MIFEEHRVAVTPMDTGLSHRFDDGVRGLRLVAQPGAAAIARDSASHYVHEPAAEPVLESWWGWRPMTPDSLPRIGRRRS